MNIDGWRAKIDLINAQIVGLLNERARYAIEIGKIKAENGQPVCDPQRENHIAEKVEEINQGPLSGKSMRRIFEIIIEESRKIEHEHSRR